MLDAAPPHYLFLPISLNSLDLAGVRLMSPHDATELKWELDEDLVRCVVSFHIDQ